MASTPVFIASGFAAPSVSLTTVNTLRTGAGSLDSIITGAPSIIKGIEFHAITTTIDTILMLFYYDGSATSLMDEIKIQQSTPTGVDSGWRYVWRPAEGTLYLPSADTIKAAMLGGSATIIARALGGIV